MSMRSPYPYGLEQNPFPSSPTPTMHDARVLGGRRHREARDAIVSCINDLYSKLDAKKGNFDARDFRLVTVVQDIGSGKTHLALHIKSTRDDVVCSYVDLSTISPKNMHGLFSSILRGFDPGYVEHLRSLIVDVLKRKAVEGNRHARKFFRPSLLSFFNSSIERLADDVVKGRREPDLRYLSNALNTLDEYELLALKKILENRFTDVSDLRSLEDMLAFLAVIARINQRFLGKVTMIEIDEFDSNMDSIEFVKAVINAHLPSTVVLLITTPSVYDSVRGLSASLFDRLEKANYKIDLVGSSTFDEIADIVLEYIRQNVKDLRFSIHESDIVSKIRVVYDEFMEFRNIRSLLNILYHAMEIAARRSDDLLSEEAIEEAIRQAYPGLRVRGSIMNVPIAEYMRIRREHSTNDALEDGVKQAVKNLLALMQEHGKISRVEYDTAINSISADAVYTDPSMRRTGVTVIFGRDYASMKGIYHEGVEVDRLVVLNNTGSSGSNGATFVSIDKCRIADLIYFSQRYSKKEITDIDVEKALLLARSILLY
ncbi:MAG: hypothetical protein RMJ59_05365 [Candidatus Nitrosocaldus sp.]|nr:hypothetical protein [Candidatus Nitrosocaldus sp.]